MLWNVCVWSPSTFKRIDRGVDLMFIHSVTLQVGFFPYAFLYTRSGEFCLSCLDVSAHKSMPWYPQIKYIWSVQDLFKYRNQHRHYFKVHFKFDDWVRLVMEFWLPSQWPRLDSLIGKKEWKGKKEKEIKKEKSLYGKFLTMSNPASLSWSLDCLLWERAVSE